ncbi:hypothetical protein HanHA300_Chr11g0399721 [Helianthus annuus]|nr:hypothetical protein HanHA300_Chr11g0399721 [Helianthus annuus]KAJ0517250.1 hypothetical protein HanHA89_Chr11g0423241 [Helianthus annuus]KAJ0685260.1 hypothetical protein HanLR1_Chr11g0400691 [Helianthus annuus]KAJ0689165.1 hypothetical protein HanOQP8_Chr11g0402661 [Helianthus annuus]
MLLLQFIHSQTTICIISSDTLRDHGCSRRRTGVAQECTVVLTAVNNGRSHKFHGFVRISSAVHGFHGGAAVGVHGFHGGA